MTGQHEHPDHRDGSAGAEARAEVALARAAMRRHGVMPLDHGAVDADGSTRAADREVEGATADSEQLLARILAGAPAPVRATPRPITGPRRTTTALRRHPGRAAAAACAAAVLVAVAVVQPWSVPAPPTPLAYSQLPDLPPDDDGGAQAASQPESADSSTSANDTGSTADAAPAPSASAPGPSAPAAATLAALAAAASARDGAVSFERSSPAPAGDEVVSVLTWGADDEAGEGDRGDPEVAPDLVVRRTAADGTATTTTSAAAPLTADGEVSADAGPYDAVTTAGSPPDQGWDPAALPRDPAALRTALLVTAPCRTPDVVSACLVTAITDVSERRVVPAHLAAALWQVLALQPDVRDLGSTQDRTGRDATAVGVTAPAPGGGGGSRTWAVLADSTTGAYLGTEVFDEPEDGTGTRVVVGFTTLLSAVPDTGR